MKGLVDVFAGEKVLDSIARPVIAILGVFYSVSLVGWQPKHITTISQCILFNFISDLF